MSRAVGGRVLVARGVDGLLVGWLAVLVWIVFFALRKVGTGVELSGLEVVYWTGAVVTAAHFGLSYHLAYRGGTRAVRARPFVLAIAPLALIAVLAAISVASFAGGITTTRHVTSALITSVYLMTTWHYVKQVYGVARVGAAYAHVSLGTWEIRILRYGLYPLWFLGAAQVLSRNTSFYLAGYHYGYALLPVWVHTALRVVALAMSLPIAAVFARVGRRTGSLPPSLLVAPYAAAMLWLGLPTDPVLSILLLAPFHALQYLAIGHRAEMALAADAPGQHGLAWWLNIFAGAACGGLLLSRWAPQFLDAHLHRSGGPLLFSAAFFVFLNLHHYLIDAAIWRSKGQLISALGRKQSRAQPLAAPAAAGAGAR